MILLYLNPLYVQVSSIFVCYPVGTGVCQTGAKVFILLTAAIAVNIFSDLGVLYLLSVFMKLLQAELFIRKLGQISDPCHSLTSIRYDIWEHNFMGIIAVIMEGWLVFSVFSHFRILMIITTCLLALYTFHKRGYVREFWSYYYSFGNVKVAIFIPGYLVSKDTQRSRVGFNRKTSGSQTDLRFCYYLIPKETSHHWLTTGLLLR